MSALVPHSPFPYVLKRSTTSVISCDKAHSDLRASMVRLYWLCLCSRFSLTKQGSLAITVAHVTIQRFFFRTFASSKRRRNSRIKNTRLNEPRSSTRESGNLVWLLRVKHIWISSEPWSARLVNCQLCWNLKKCCGDEKFLVSLSLSSTRNRRQKSVPFFNIRRQC